MGLRVDSPCLLHRLCNGSEGGKYAAGVDLSLIVMIRLKVCSILVIAGRVLSNQSLI